MLIPYGTDAPIYYRPFATVSFIAINVVMFWLTGMGEVCNALHHEHRWLILEFNRINPLQWLTAAFMHASWGHLLGNMVFLWCFGLVVEGKLGWHKFSLLYLTLCLAKGAVTQVPMFLFWSSDAGGALGASGAIFALMAVAICWAPENDMHCLFTWWFPFVRTFDVPIFGLGFFYFLLQLLPLLLGGFHMSTPMLHLLGMLVGFPVAIYMLKHKMVDCEGWDVISRWNHLPKSPLMLIGSLVQSREKRANAKVLATAYDRRSEHDALKQILANPSAFNPQPPPQSDQPPPQSNQPPPQSNQPSARKHQPAPQCQQPTASVPERAAVSAPTRNDFLQNTVAAFGLALKAKEPDAATDAFCRIHQNGGTHAIADNSLATYATLLSKHGRHIESLEPLTILVSRRGRCRNQACLRIARIQLQLQDDPTAAQASLQQMVRPWNHKIEAKRRQVAQAIETNMTIASQR